MCRGCPRQPLGIAALGEQIVWCLFPHFLPPGQIFFFGRKGECTAADAQALAETPWNYNGFVLIWCLPSNLALSVFLCGQAALLCVSSFPLDFIV